MPAAPASHPARPAHAGRAATGARLARIGWDVQANGLFSAPELTVLIGENAHATLVRAIGRMTLRRERGIRVPADEQCRMYAGRLPEGVIGPAVICAQACEINPRCM